MSFRCAKATYLRAAQKDAEASRAAANAVEMEGEEEDPTDDQTSEVALAARQLFTGGVAIRGEREAARDHTVQMVAEGQRVIYDAVAMTRGLLAQAHVLVREDEENRWRMYGVKDATQVDEWQIRDAAFQTLGFREAGYDIASSHLVHVNSAYTRGAEIDPHALLNIVDISKEVAGALPKVREEIEGVLRWLARPAAPLVLIGPQCKKSKPCRFMADCWHDVPRPSIFDLRMSDSKRERLRESGVFGLKDLTLTTVPGKKKDTVLAQGVELTDNQVEQVQLAKMGTRVNIPEIAETLGKLRYPLYFLDYEFDCPAIPQFEGMQPHDYVVFQYSLQVQQEPGGALTHHSFLSRDPGNPMPALLASLQEKIGPEGTVIVWSETAEKSRNFEMAARYPEYLPFIQSVNGRVFDLMTVVSEKKYVHEALAGRKSLKVMVETHLRI